jgi:hypothetical protein
MSSADRYVATSTTTFTASRTVTLPAANALNPGMLVMISDDGSAITSAFTLSIARAGSDTINEQANPVILKSPWSSLILASDGVNNWTIIARHPTQNYVTLTSGTVYTPSVGTKALGVQCIGGGGGGGGSVGGANKAAGGGGGSGGYSAVFIVAPKPSYSYAIGTGSAGVSGGNPSAGGDTTFDSPSVCTAKGGSGGISMASVTAGISNGGLGGLASGGVGDFKSDGNSGSPGYLSGNANPMPGIGGAGIYGGANRTTTAAEGAGAAGGSYGAGGSGSISIGSSWAGGNGANGAIIIWEFF